MVRGIAAGRSRRAVAAQFEVAPSTAVRVQARFVATGSVDPAKQGRRKGSGKLGPYREAILDKVKAQPDITMPDLAAWLEAAHGVTADPSNLSKLLCRHGFTYKKTLLASEKERADVKSARRMWCDRRQPFMRRQPGRLVFIDETSVKTNMTPVRGRSPKGERLIADAPFGKWQTQTFIAGLRCDELVAPWIVEGAMDGPTFDNYIRTQLAPSLRRGDVVILDNLSVHKVRVRHRRWPNAAPGSCSCQNTPPTSIPSKWLSPSSRPSCERPRRELMTPSGAPWAISATSSSLRNAGTISRTQAMPQINRLTL
jgi:transposase